MARILVVEDNELNMEVLVRRLTRAGHQVLQAGDGRAALETARAEMPDLVIMDMSLPEIDGWEATRRLRADPATQRIPVLALTAHALSTDRDLCLAAGCNDYDTKPIDVTRLMQKVTALLQPPSSHG
jgi:CheY-like chemotaxis protein